MGRWSGADLPLFFNGRAAGRDADRDDLFPEVGAHVRRRFRAVPKTAATLPARFARAWCRRRGDRAADLPAQPAVTVSFALLLAFFRATWFDFWGVVACVAMMSISSLFYIIGGQYLVSKIWRLVPISGYGGDLDAWRFLLLPVLIGVVAGIGALDALVPHHFPWRRSAGLRAHRAGEGAFRVGGDVPAMLRNALIPILTGVVVVIPLLFMGSLLTESFFGIPGLGSYHRRHQRAGFRGGAGDGLHRFGAPHRRPDPDRYFLHAGRSGGSVSNERVSVRAGTAPPGRVR